MSASTIVFLIDIQNGFACDGLSDEEGGSLYVPGGEQVGAPAAKLIEAARDTVFVLSQDFHPRDHISFAVNHGVTPFSDIRLQRDQQGVYQVDAQGEIVQTAWPVHCVQGSYSALPVAPVLQALPPSLRQKLATDDQSEALFAEDGRGNRFHVIRKGMRRDLDSYGVATENDLQSTTYAPVVFKDIARSLQQHGVSEVRVAIGGLATNYCVEFSYRDVHALMLPALAACGIEASVFLLRDLCAGIAVTTADGGWPDLAGAERRMAQMGCEVTTSADF